MSAQLPTGLSYALFLRVAPGFVGAFLILFSLGRLEHIPLSEAITLISTWGLLLGFALALSRYPIWAFYEGRWFWASPISRIMIRHLQKKLQEDFELSKQLRQQIDELSSADGKDYALLDELRSKYNEVWFRIRQFPEDPKLHWSLAGNLTVGMRKVIAPTRFGNIVAEFERYPSIKYGIDSIFFWYRLRFLLQKESYETIDNAAATVDSLVSFSVVLVALAVFYLVVPPNHTIGSLVAIACLLFSYLVYRFSLQPLRSYGEYFKSIFDLYRQDIFPHMQNLIPAPTNIDEEFAYWRQIRGYLLYRFDLPKKDTPIRRNKVRSK